MCIRDSPRLLVRAIVIAVAVIVWYLAASWILDFGKRINYEFLHSLGQPTMDMVQKVNPYIWWVVAGIWTLIVFFIPVSYTHLVHAGCDLVKIMATGGVMTPGVSPMDAHYSFDEMQAGVHEAKRFRKSTASHAQGTQGILNAVRAGIDSIEHGIFMDEQCLSEMLAAETYLVPTIAAVRNIVANADNGIPAYAVEKALSLIHI